MARDFTAERYTRSLLTQVDTLPLNRRHWLVFGVCAAGFLFDSMDLQIMSLIAPVLLHQWKLTPQALGAIISAAVIGMLCGSYLFGTLSDRIGRRVGFQVTIALFAGCSALCALTQNPLQLMVLRFCVGLGIGGFTPIDTALLTEYMPLRWRGRLLALWAIMFPLGALVATGLVSVILPLGGWRGVFLMGALPAGVILLVRKLVPETPRFLFSRGRFAEAEQSLRWIAAGSKLGDATYQQEAPVARQGAKARNPVSALFSPAYRQRTLVAWVLWFCWSFAYYGIILWLPTLLVLLKIPLTQVLMYTLGFQLAAIVGRIVMMLLVDRIGRRPLIIIAGLAAGVLMLIFGLQHLFVWLLLAGYALSFFQEGGYSGIVPYTPELYPTTLRSTGCGWANGAGRLAGLLAPLLVGEMVAAHLTFIPFLAFAVCYICASMVVWVLSKETKGAELEETWAHESAPGQAEILAPQGAFE